MAQVPEIELRDILLSNSSFGPNEISVVLRKVCNLGFLVLLVQQLQRLFHWVEPIAIQQVLIQKSWYGLMAV